jgi:thiol reductant ABC exporter CydC subunit
MIRRLAGLAADSRPQLALSVLLGFLAIASSLALMATSGFLISKAALQPPILDLAVAIVAVRAFGIARGVFRYLERVTSHDLALRLLSELRVWLYRTLEPLAPAGLEEFRSGDLLARMVADVEALQDFFLRVLAPPMVAALILGLTIGVVWSVAPIGVLALAVPFLFAGLALPLVARHLARPLAAAHARLRGELSVELVELLQGASEVAAFGRRGEQLDRIRVLDASLARNGRRRASLTGLLEGSAVALTGLAVGGVLALTVPLTSTGRIDGVYLATVALATMASFEAVQQLPDAFARLEQSLAAAARLFKVGERPAPVTDPAQPLAVSAGAIALTGAWLRYRPSGPWALAGIDLRIEAGSRVALIGPSGSGKTTVANVLVRFRELDRGQATLGGHDLRDYGQDDVRRVIGLCEQDPHLFNTTILSNVRLARPTATQDELDAAARRGRVLDWISSLPEGWDTRVGEAGAMVSGGQRQRISLARALLADFPILILDEPAANLEPELARELMADILQATSGRSVLLITHRLEGLEAMDQIMVMEEGQIVERGTHEELMVAGGRYREMRALELSA